MFSFRLVPQESSQLREEAPSIRRSVLTTACASQKVCVHELCDVVLRGPALCTDRGVLLSIGRTNAPPSGCLQEDLEPKRIASSSQRLDRARDVAIRHAA